MNKLVVEIDKYRKYLERVEQIQQRDCCVCPEELHIVGYSDGATTIARWLNKGSPGAGGVPKPPVGVGLIGLVDLVRTHVLPNYDPKKTHLVGTSSGSAWKAVRANEGGFLSWAGHLIVPSPPWDNIFVGVSHSQIPWHIETIWHLRDGLYEALEVRKKLCECFASEVN